MFLARASSMFESEDFCYLTIVKTPTGLDPFLVEMCFVSASHRHPACLEGRPTSRIYFPDKNDKNGSILAWTEY